MISATDVPEHLLPGWTLLKEKVVIENIQIPFFIGHKTTDGLTHRIQAGDKEYFIPVASPEYTVYIEDCVMAISKPFQSVISSMSEIELEAYSRLVVMKYDVERGLVMGQVPHIHFQHSPSFVLWERKLFRQIDAQYAVQGEDMENRENLLLPFERSYWVFPGRLMAGEIPSSKDEETRKIKVKNMVSMRFDVVINLMEEGEKTFSGDVLADYIADLNWESKRIAHPIEIYRFPIKDLSITCPDNMLQIIQTIHHRITEGKKVYVHCWGGIGRTGTVIGCYLMEYGYATEHNVLPFIDYLKRSTPVKDRLSPETDEQRDYVIDWHILKQSAGQNL